MPGLGIGAYTTTKFAIVGFSESLRGDLAREGIGVSVLCPGGVRTRIRSAARNRPAALGGTGARELPQATLPDQGMDPALVGPMVVEGVKGDELYIFTHAGSEMRRQVAARCEAMAAAFERWAARHARRGAIPTGPPG
jgi:NAD(P)-dependent dehydrogenase (short-subunit alcohol dehydrogenase family)